MSVDLGFGDIEWIDEDVHLVRQSMRDARREHELSKRVVCTERLLKEAVVHKLNARFYKATQDLDVSSFTSVTGQATIGLILNELLAIGSKCGVKRIRYYRFEETQMDGQMVIVDSAGHPDDVARRLREGSIVRFRSACPLRTCDSFWCLALGVPALFLIEPSAAAKLEPLLYPNCLPLIRTPVDSCERDLSGHKLNLWLDMPLTVAGTAVGKLTCDVDASIESLTSLTEGFVRLWAAANSQAPYLESLYRGQFSFLPGEIMAEMQYFSTKEEVFEYCTTQLAARFGCNQASIFTRTTDCLGATKFVLRDTSFDASKHLRNKGCYDLNEDALTAWVARNNIPLRLHDLDDDQKRETQLAALRIFDNHLTWQHKIRDSVCDTAFLAVPIPGDLNQVDGVLRFVEKNTPRDGECRFTERDQTLLVRIAREAIGPRLLALRRVEAAMEYSTNELQEVNAPLVSNAVPTANEIAAVILRMLTTYFPTCEQHKKLYLINLLADDGQSLVHYRIGGNLRDDIQEGAKYKLNGSLTEYTLNANKSAASTFLINDFANARRQNAMIQSCTTAETALSGAIVFRDQPYGVLIVKSDSHDLHSERCSRMLKLICAQAAAMFARRELGLLKRFEEDLQQQAARCINNSGMSYEGLIVWLREIEQKYRGGSVSLSRVPVETVNVKDAVVSATDAAVHEVANAQLLVLDLPDVEVRTYGAALATITYGILREIFTGQPSETCPVVVTAECEEKEWLKLSIEQSVDQGSERKASSHLLGSCSHDDDPDVHALWRMLAYNHISAGRRGRFSFKSAQQGSPACFTLRLPIDRPRTRSG